MIPAFTAPGMRHFFGTRQSPTLAMLITEIPGGERPPRVVVSVRQVHGTDSLIIDRQVEPGSTFSGSWDALITNQPGVLVTVKTADCVPVLIHDPHSRVVAAIHAGWRGAIAGIVTKTLETMVQQFGCRVETTRIGIGPSAGPCCYEVDRAVLDPLRERYSYWQTVVRETDANRGHLDLRALIGRQVAAMGIPDGRVSTVNACTICLPARFYSYRRDGVVNGTMISGIMLEA